MKKISQYHHILFLKKKNFGIFSCGQAIFNNNIYIFCLFYLFLLNKKKSNKAKRKMGGSSMVPLNRTSSIENEPRTLNLKQIQFARVSSLPFLIPFLSSKIFINDVQIYMYINNNI